MRKQFLVAVLVLVAIDVAADKPKFTSSWRSPEASGVSFFGKKVAALVITSDEHLRVSGEEELARQLATRGIQGVPTYRMAPREELSSAERARPWFERAGIQGVVALRPVSRETVVTGSPTVYTTSNYSTLWGYYGYGYTTVIDFSGPRSDTTIVLETLIYSVPLDRLLWGGVSTTFNPKDTETFLKDLVSEAVKEMQKRGLINK
jgi:hypothetical protein